MEELLTQFAGQGAFCFIACYLIMKGVPAMHNLSNSINNLAESIKKLESQSEKVDFHLENIDKRLDNIEKSLFSLQNPVKFQS